jgi:hypothetical protein
LVRVEVLRDAIDVRKGAADERVARLVRQTHGVVPHADGAHASGAGGPFAPLRLRFHARLRLDVAHGPRG